MYSLRQKVIWFAGFSRISVLLVQCISNALIADHDAKGVFRRPMLPTNNTSFPDQIVDILLGGLERWDAQYFLHIAENGYVYENSVAFFPLFPLAVRFLSGCFNIVTYSLLAPRSLVLLASVLLNTVCFVKAADALFFLSLRILENEALAYKAALLFCINPASIFFSAPYSEALFVLLSFQGMRHSLDSQYSKLSAIPFGLSAAARSNGVLNVGFILYKSVQDFISVEWPLLFRKKGLKNTLLLPLKLVPSLYHMIESCTIALAPFVAYQVYCYALFCTPQKWNIPEHLIKYGQNNGLVLPEFVENYQRSSDHWCYFKLPLAYSYVQDHYWNVGFFRYYEWKQLPNFMLACPILLLVFLQSKTYFQQHRSLFLSLGFVPKYVKEKQMKSQKDMSPNMFVFIVHIVCLSLFCIAFVHIQVTTRMICSASPVPYWYAAYLLQYRKRKGSNGKARARDGAMLVASQLKKLRDKIPNQEDSLETLDNMTSRWRVMILSVVPVDWKGKLILIYFLSYSFVGTILFCNFLPWT